MTYIITVLIIIDYFECDINSDDFFVVDNIQLTFI